MWREQVRALGDAGVENLAIDLPGHGARADEEFTLEAAAAAIQEGVETLPAPRVVVGLSLGGYLALHWAARTPTPPAAVLAASCSTRPRGLALAGYAGVAGLIERLPDHGLWLNDTMAACTLPAGAIQDVAAGGIALAVMVPALRAMRGADPIGDLARIDVPVWFVNGAWDHFRTEEQRFLAASRQGRLIVLARARHLASFDAPVAFNRVMLDLLEAVEASA